MNNVHIPDRPDMLPPVDTSKPDCGRCKFTTMERLPGQIQRLMVCRRLPPVPVMQPTQQGLAVNFTFPVVVAGMFCYCYEPVDDAKDTPPAG